MQAKRLPTLPRSAAMRLASRLFVLGTAMGLVPAGAAQGTRVESSQHGDVVEIHAAADLSADRDTAWRILTDYGRYSAFIPGLSESRVVARHGASVIVEQAGTAALGPLHIPVEVTFQIEESPPDGLASRVVSGALRSLESRYTLVARAPGSRLLYAGRVRTGSPLLAGLGRSAIEDNVARQFRALVDEIERQRGGDPAAPADARP